MLNRFYALMTVMISSAGLISCSPDKTKQDDWQVSAPVIKSASGSSPMVDLHSGFTGEIAADSSLSFASNRSAAGTSISTHSECSRKSDKSTLDRNFSDNFSVPVASLLPDAIIYSTSLEKAVCQFKFSLNNSDGSSRSFETRPMTIANLKTLENFPLDETQFTPEQISKLSLSNVLHSAERIGAETSVNALICDNFQNSRVRQRGQTDEEIMTNLASGTVNDPLNPKLVADPAQDGRVSDSIQNCKLVFSNQRKGHAVEILTSTPFTMTFPVSKPEFEFVQGPKFSANSNLQNFSPIQLVIKNPTTTDLTYKVNVDNFGFDTEIWGGASSTMFGLRTYSSYSYPAAPIVGWFGMETDRLLERAQNEVTVLVPAKGSTTVRLQIQSSLNCPVQNQPDLTVIDILGKLVPEPCHDWNSCTAIFKINFIPRGQVKVAQAVHARPGTNKLNQFRDQESVAAKIPTTSVESDAIAQFAARGFTPEVTNPNPAHPIPEETQRWIGEKLRAALAGVHICN